MKRMTLRKLELSGAGKKDAVLMFHKGLNVITGDSDTGKTYAFQCLNYMLGAEKKPKSIKESKGYSKLALEFYVDDELYRLERGIGNSKIDVIHNETRTNLSYKHDPVNTNNLSRYLLSILLESSDVVQLRKNKKNVKRTLSFRDIVHLCTVAETDIIAETSAFQSIQHTEQTVRKSVLKYIITGIDDSAEMEKDDPGKENIKRAGVVQFLVKKRAYLNAKIEEIEGNTNYQLYSSNNSIGETAQQITSHRKAIAELNVELTKKQTQIRKLQQSCFQDEVRVKEFIKLRSHYEEEQRKNGMITSHADFLVQLPHLGCPICNQIINPSIITSENEESLFQYFKSKHSELQCTIEDLNLSIRDISERIAQVQAEIILLQRKNTDLSQAIERHQNVLENLIHNITIIRQLDEMKKSLEIYRQELIAVEQDIVVYSEKVKNSPDESLSQDLSQYDSFCRCVETVLREWGFGDKVQVSFDENLLDLVIDDKSRADWGKGYRAFIMSAMVVGLMRYCIQHSRIHPGFVIIDSPLVSLKERKKDENEKWVDDYMERKMIEDILKSDSERQVIIFENKDLQYNFDYNYVEFRHEGGERQGFIQ